MIDNNAEAGLLQNCPNCGYCLRGLQIEQRCPECGQLFDRGWQVFGGTSRWNGLGFWGRTGAVLMQVGILASIADDVWEIYTVGRTSVLDLMLGFWIAWELISLWYLFSRPTAFIGVGLTGLTVGKLKTGELTTYCWADVDTVSLQSDGFLLLKMKGGVRKIDAWRANNRDATRCVDYIEDYLNGLRQSEPGPVSPSV